jgi:hypothetical protein
VMSTAWDYCCLIITEDVTRTTRDGSTDAASASIL